MGLIHLKYNTILFDLDGTLTESGIGITRSVAYAYEKLGLPVPCLLYTSDAADESLPV